MDFENFEIALVLLGQFQKIRKYTRPPKNLISIVLITCGNVIVNPLQQKKMFLKNYETVKLRLLNFETVCVCVCLYSSTVKASSVCKMSKTYLRVRINDLVL